MNNRALAEFLGSRVKVWSGDQGLTDEGVLEEFDFPWLKLRKDDGEVLCLSVFTVRLVKPAARAR